MALLTALPLDAARELGARYGLDVEAVVGIPAGSVNSNYRLDLAAGGRAFLRVYEEQGRAAAETELALLDHLCARGVTTPRPIRLSSDDGFLATFAGKPVAVFPWVDGEIVCQAQVRPPLAREVGAALAQVHLAGQGFRGAGEGRFRPADLAARLRALPNDAREGSLGRDVAMLERRLGALPRTPEARGVIHADLFRDNVLWGSKSPTKSAGAASTADATPRIVALLDFESASLGSFAFDLAVTMLAWCYGDDLDLELAAALAAGYAAVRPLGSVDLEELPDQARFAAVRFSITRITDFELRPRGTGVYKDYRRFLGRLAALDVLGDAGIRALFSGRLP